MGSDNPTGADNQQETVKPRLELDPRWVVGFVDGEGCFSVSVHRNPQNARATGGWQLHPVFHVYQHERHRAVLEAFAAVFGCGRVRSKGPGSSVLTYAVASLLDIDGGRAVVDQGHRRKQPDWTFDETYSGQSPADRLDQRLEEATTR